MVVYNQSRPFAGLRSLSASDSLKTFHVCKSQVLRATGCTYASDVYSFGIVAWEVLSRELPWANLPNPDHVYIHVVLNARRPEIPVEAPEDIADMMRACWSAEPKDRPEFSSIMKALTVQGWRE